jgi:hypothetical protein
LAVQPGIIAICTEEDDVGEFWPGLVDNEDAVVGLNIGCVWPQILKHNSRGKEEV